MKQTQSHYDFIICGGGMAGLSVAYYLNISTLRDKSILIIEPEEKNKNDRTWAFWEKGNNTFEHLLFKKWNAVRFTNNKGEKKILDIGEYHYKLLRGIDFYEYVISELKKNPKIEWQKEKVIDIKYDSFPKITTTTSSFTATYVFDSTFKLKLNLPENHNLLQHFKGLVIRTSEPVFDVMIPDKMNFAIPQKNDECRFVYILPFSENEALIEFTLFSEKLLSQTEYDFELKNFIETNLQITDYQVIEEEFGVIPMSDEPTNEFPFPNIIRIGTAGGHTNPATGYTFQNTQKRLEKIVKNLEKTGSPIIKDSWFKKRFLLYASVLLNVILKKRYPAGEIFDQLYSKNPPTRIFRFLDGESNFFEDILVMWSTPKSKFIAAVLDVLRLKIKKL